MLILITALLALLCTWSTYFKFRCHETLNKINFFIVLTDIDINSYDGSSIEVPSINSYRMTQDVMCVKPSSHRGGMGSFRSTRDTVRSTNSNVPNGKSEKPFIMYRGTICMIIMEIIIIFNFFFFSRTFIQRYPTRWTKTLERTTSRNS